MNFLKRAFSSMGRWTGLSRNTPTDPMIEVAETLTGQLGEETLQEGTADTCPTGLLDLSVLDEHPTSPSAEALEAIEPQPEPVGFIAEAFAGPVVEENKIEEVKEEPKTPVELKPEKPKPSVTFTQLYELIAAEVNKRTDSAVTVYEKLLAATREELEATRKNNRMAWSVGGVMTAVAAFGAIWAAGEVSATRVEVSGLKAQVSSGQQALAERDQLRVELTKVKEQTARVEMEKLKSRLDEALAASDRLAKEMNDVSAELKLARAATTQPVSQATPVIEKANGAERPDVWSVLLNGER